MEEVRLDDLLDLIQVWNYVFMLTINLNLNIKSFIRETFF